MKIKSQAGFTIVEMLIVGSILVVLLAIGVPGLQTFIQNNRILAQTNLFMTSIKSARSEAMTQRQPITICMSNNGTNCAGTWAEGHIAFIDFDGDGAFDAGDNDTVINYNQTDNPDITITYTDADGNALNFINFDRRGRAVGSSGALLFCDDRGSDFARGITIDPIGRSRTTGGALVCP